MPALFAALCITFATGTAAAGAAARPAAVPAGHYTGTLPDGATWIADTPAHWNGTLVLFSHGFGPTLAADAPSAASADALLAQGYALAGSSYDPSGSWWALASAERDQFATLAAAEHLLGRPGRVLSVGESMGGLVNSQITQDGAGRVDAALNLCGLVAGAVDLNNYQLNAEYAITALLPGAAGVQIRDFSSPDAGAAAAAQLAAAITGAQSSAAGRARIALASALLNESDWAAGQDAPAPRDYAGQEAQEYTWLTSGQLTFIEFGRYYLESAAGGDSGWNAGVDYSRLIRGSAHYDQVRALYRQAGLNLDADLGTLTRGAHYTPDPGSLASMQATSTNTGHLGVPLLDVHTTSDQLVPVEQENAFAAKVRAAGDERLLRQAYVARQGHCNFTTAEIVAALDTVDRRAKDGHWIEGTGAADLQAAALALNLDGGAFVRYRPAALVVQNPAPCGIPSPRPCR
ncbi:alpha/beta hydrolase [Actinocrinis puniceicyclus]|uniref:Alpha/beta hydrolase n=1 Tax=Actinocrinis puniceicyclus TaxID=977794 RepID=A0A8J7WNW6_9ACTN|nr:alpha/beta hydrolase [Actinocrinis puniceicyclus]MBS2965861.1 alpha/beta hydrolase [Actinocrinis puniceicyclus]